MYSVLCHRTAGVDYVKMDWCGYDLTNSTQQHTEFSQALNATGRHIFFELCRGCEHCLSSSFLLIPSSYSLPPPAYCPEVANSWRVTGDHQDYWASTLYEMTALINQSYQAYVCVWC
jgi:alpha-galactosidase